MKTRKQNLSPASTLLANAEVLFNRNRLSEAHGLVQRLLNDHPNHGGALHLMGLISARLNQPGKAVEYLALASRHDKKNPALWFNYASILTDTGDHKASEQAFRKLIKLKTNNPRAHNGLGISLSQQGRHKEAVQCFQRATLQDGKFHDAYNNLGLAHLSLGNLDEAIESLTTALKLDPASFRAQKNLGSAYLAKGDYDRATTYYRSALEQQKNSIDILLNLYTAAFKYQRFNDVKRIIGELDSAGLEKGRVYYYYGDYYSEVKDFEQAEHYYRLAEKEGFNKKSTAIKRARFYSRLGNFDQTRQLLDSILKEDPEHADALLLLVKISKGDINENIVAQLQELGARESLDETQRCRILFSLGKIFDDTEDYDKAFEFYQRGNELRNESFSGSEFHGHISSIIRTFDQAYIDKWSDQGSNSQKPVFVIGMPRSGTTLTEQILASHPQIYGAGEQPYFGHLERRISLELESSLAYPDCMVKAQRSHIEKLQTNYQNYIESISPDSKRVVDKMPTNFLHLGLIALLLPNAKIIYCTRAPMDNCLSIYFQNFAGSHPYAYDLEHIGIFYREHQRLMSHWKSVLPNPIFDLEYESLVSDSETMARRLIEFIGLDWDDRCLAHHETGGTVKTASIWQARQPIYNTSVERWRNYQSHLEPLRLALEKADNT